MGLNKLPLFKREKYENNIYTYKINNKNNTKKYDKRKLADYLIENSIDIYRYNIYNNK